MKRGGVALGLRPGTPHRHRHPRGAGEDSPSGTRRSGLGLAWARGGSSPGCANILCGAWSGPLPAGSDALGPARGSLRGRCLRAAFRCFLLVPSQVIFRVRHRRWAGAAWGGCVSVAGEGSGVPFTKGKAKQPAWLRRRGWKFKCVPVSCSYV